MWDLIIARILFRPRISLGTGLAVPIVSHNTASSLYILSPPARGNVYGHIYIRASFYETFRPSGWAAVNLLYDWKNLSIYINIYYIYIHTPTGSGPTEFDWPFVVSRFIFSALLSRHIRYDKRVGEGVKSKLLRVKNCKRNTWAIIITIISYIIPIQY